jgi:signal transduction histidine kinase
MLPIQEPVRELISEACQALQPQLAEVTVLWRQRVSGEFQFEQPAMAALERLNLGGGCLLFSNAELQKFDDNLNDCGRRLATLRVDPRQVARSMEIYLQILVPRVARLFGERRLPVMAALEKLVSASFVTISGAYYDVQQSASGALLQVMDAETPAPELSAPATDRAQMAEALRESELRNAELSGHLLRAQEEERKRISRELHDETGQALMVIRLYLGMLAGSVKPRAGKDKVRELLAVVDRTIEGIRRIIGRLSPLVLQELGLESAIRQEASELTRTTGVLSRVVIGDDVGRLEPAVETAIYRVVQEGLHNVAKHARAKNVDVEIERHGESLSLVIQDDGAGMQRTENPGRPSFGIAGMQERIDTLGGQMQVSSGEGEGTRIAVTVPAALRQEAEEQAPPLAAPQPLGMAN